MTKQLEKKLKEPWKQPWPADDLELVKQCPVCGERQREILYSTLVDKLFRVARGKWTLWACENCGSAYLDPRPSPASIGRAYGTYYTHETNVSEQISADQLSFMRKIRRAISNGYLNARFGTHRSPA